MILAPMVWPEVLPKPTAMLTLLLPPVPLPPPPKGDLAPRLTRVVAKHPFIDPSGRYIQPVKAPEKIDMTPDDPPVASGSYVIGGVPGGTEGGVRDGILGGIIGAPTVAPPVKPAEKPRVEAAAPEPAPIKRYQVGGLVKMATVIRRVDPVYPPLARQTRTSGAVELQGVIGTDGRIRELKVLKGHPLLVKAAVDAVWQWIYSPTTLNGEPVEVIAPITVNFILN